MSHDETHADMLPHASLRDYAIGFGLSVVLTAIPFWLVMAGPLPHVVTAAIILGFAVVQMIVHMVYFLHLSGKLENGWSLAALGFTLILVMIMMSGSLWVMYHLNTNMMSMPADMRHAP